MSLEAKEFLDNKQEQHFKQFGVYADVNSKLAEWMQEYNDKQNSELLLENGQIIETIKEKTKKQCDIHVVGSSCNVDYKKGFRGLCKCCDGNGWVNND